jgi:hypothetical protein
MKNQGLNLMIQLLFKRVDANVYFNLQEKSAKAIA